MLAALQATTVLPMCRCNFWFENFPLVFVDRRLAVYALSGVAA